MRKRAVRRRVCAVGLAVVLLAVGYYFTGKHYPPRVVVPGGLSLSGERAGCLAAAEQGYYNAHLPIFARKILILEAGEDRVLYRVYYFPFGAAEKSYTREDTGNWVFSQERPLSGLQ